MKIHIAETRWNPLFKAFFRIHNTQQCQIRNVPPKSGMQLAYTFYRHPERWLKQGVFRLFFIKARFGLISIPVGFMTMFFQAVSPPTTWLCELWIAPFMRKKGFGSAAILYASTLAALERNNPTLHVTCHHSITPFWKRFRHVIIAPPPLSVFTGDKHHGPETHPSSDSA